MRATGKSEKRPEISYELYCIAMESYLGYYKRFNNGFATFYLWFAVSKTQENGDRIKT